MTAEAPPRMRLRAADAEDFAVVAACLQSALMPLGEMAYLAPEHRFVAVFDRFTWECATPGVERARDLYQVSAGLRFEGVSAVQVNGIDQTDKSRVLELLTLAARPGAVSLVFAGGGAVRLEGTQIVALLEDLGEARPAAVLPRTALGT
ncbi:MAG: DUF2948 family protein [Alphaproteobacteria bacterium]|jgi:hypothetical protein|nr:DUF2948 family protein [Alphaproteobacteria bacterium]MDP6517644.1 DUF2948 family protein [Alphaproteobacteria bacterium]